MTEPAEYAARIREAQARRQALVREELLASPWLTPEELAQRRGLPPGQDAPAVERDRAAHRLLVVTAAEAVLVPAFQLTDRSDTRSELAPVLERLLASGTDPWLIWGWLTRPAALLGGQVPDETLRDPAEADLVLRAAVSLAERAT